jgi:AMIN domain
MFFTRLRHRQRQEFTLWVTKFSSRFDTRLVKLLSGVWTLRRRFDSLDQTDRDCIQRQRIGALRIAMTRRSPDFSRARVSRPVVAFIALVAVVVVVVVVVRSASVVVAAGVETAPGAAQAAGTTAIRRIAIATRGPAAVVTIEGSGNLPLPTPGFADEPPRLFFDFPGVTLAAPRMTSSTDPRIRRIRAAVHSASPLITRVVLDLVASETYRLEQASGRITVIIGGPAVTAGIPPVPPLPEGPPPPAPAAPREAREPTIPAPPPTVPPLPSPSPSPSSATATAPPPLVANPQAKPKAPLPSAGSRSVTGEASSALPARDLDRYKRQVAPTLDRLRLQQPLLMSLEGSEPQTVDRVQLAAEEFERLRQELIGIKSPESLRAQHDMLFQSTTLALMAMRLTLEAVRTSDPATLRNAASAAAGASLLLDRACADLGCPELR